jgi:hypothetical protein
MAWYIVGREEHRPRLLRWLFPRQPDGGLAIGVTDIQDGRKSFGYLGKDVRLWAYSSPFGKINRADRMAFFEEADLTVDFEYSRINLPAFNRTYRAICNSLRIE